MCSRHNIFAFWSRFILPPLRTFLYFNYISEHKIKNISKKINRQRHKLPFAHFDGKKTDMLFAVGASSDNVGGEICRAVGSVGNVVNPSHNIFDFNKI